MIFTSCPHSDTGAAVDRLLRALSAEVCPYRVSAFGVCITGCWEEPRCMTEEPAGGWTVEASAAADNLAEELRLDAGERAGQHGAVKHLRDQARHASRIARLVERGALA